MIDDSIQRWSSFSLSHRMGEGRGEGFKALGKFEDKSRVRFRVSHRLGLGTCLSLFCFFGLLFCFSNASGQAPPNNTIKHFRAPLKYFDPPHELQMQSFLEGAEAEPQSDGLILIRDAKLQTFHEDGSREMTVVTPHCLFNSKEQTVSSSGPLQMQTSDDKLLLEGEGFFWRETNSDLTISNRVLTTIRGPLTNSFAP